MITDLKIKVDSKLFNDALNSIPAIDFKLAINIPTGNFFYDKWTIAPEFKGTAWEQILDTLPYAIGEARLIKLSKQECYMSHADIDNRWHLPIVLGKSFLVDLTTNTMHKLDVGHWYYMDAGRDHSAVNFGEAERIQLVVRELLVHGNIANKKLVTIKPCEDLPNLRYLFDNVYSPWLNKMNSSGLMDDFKIEGDSVSFELDASVEIPTHKSFSVLQQNPQGSLF